MTDDGFWIEENDLDRFQRMKRKRIKAVRDKLKKLKKVKLKEFTAQLAINCGIHETTALKYLEILETVGEISIKEGMITYNENSDSKVHGE